MATTVADPIFVDANILVYSTTSQSPFHGNAIAKLQALATVGHPLWTSRQVFREYLAAMSRPGTLTVPVPMTSLINDVQVFEAHFNIAEDGAVVTAHLLQLLGALPCAGKQVHDANIVATMLAQGITNLLTHNVADFIRFGALITTIPLIP
jgi:predicted nucleic acid-binding protein